MTWRARREQIDSGRVCKIGIDQRGAPISYADVIEGWKNNPDFRRFYRSLIADCRFDALFWETPPLDESTLAGAYEFVLVDSPRLAAVRADAAAFTDYFARAGDDESVLVLENLGKDALLVVPCPRSAARNYNHLASFLRRAPDAQYHEFFRRLAQAIEAKISSRPLWVSTSGLGVYWLHARLDSRPKYYTYTPYRQRTI